MASVTGGAWPCMGRAGVRGGGMPLQYGSARAPEPVCGAPAGARNAHAA